MLTRLFRQLTGVLGLIALLPASTGIAGLIRTRFLSSQTPEGVRNTETGKLYLVTALVAVVTMLLGIGFPVLGSFAPPIARFLELAFLLIPVSLFLAGAVWIGSLATMITGADRAVLTQTSIANFILAIVPALLALFFMALGR